MEIKEILIIMMFVGLFSINLSPSFAQSGCPDPNLTKQQVEDRIFTINLGLSGLEQGSPVFNELDFEKSQLEQCIASFEAACSQGKKAVYQSTCATQGYDIGKYDKPHVLDLSQVNVPSAFPNDVKVQAEYNQCFMTLCNEVFNVAIEEGEKQRQSDEQLAREAGETFGITEEDVKEVVGGEEIAEIYEQNCVIATASYGSPMAKEVQMLREIRDNQLLQTQSGSAFMGGFNTVYYSFAPTIAKWEQENPAFKEIVKTTITPLIASLSLLNNVSMDSEAEVLGYGISLILLNIGMYFVAPVAVVWQVKKRI